MRARLVRVPGYQSSPKRAIGRDGISATKFKASSFHFLSDVFVAVAAVVA